MMILSLPLDFVQACDAALEIVKYFGQHFQFSHIWVAGHRLEDIRGI